MFRLYKYLSKKEIFMFIGLLAFLVGQIICDVTMPTYTAEIVRKMQQGAAVSSILATGGIMLAFAAGSILANIAETVLSVYISNNLGRRIRGEVFSHVVGFSDRDANSFSAGSLLTRTTNDVQQVVMAMVLGLRLGVGAPLMAVMAIVKIAQTSGELTIAVAVFDKAMAGIPLFDARDKRGECVSLNDNWLRRKCRSIDHPNFAEAKEVSLPDRADAEYPKFSGFYRYDREIVCGYIPVRAVLEVTEAHECVELFVNDMRVGMQIAPPFVFDLTGYLRKGRNSIGIEVATTLERELSYLPDPAREWLGLGEKEVTTSSGLDGKVNLYLTREP